MRFYLYIGLYKNKHEENLLASVFGFKNMKIILQDVSLDTKSMQGLLEQVSLDT